MVCRGLMDRIVPCTLDCPDMRKWRKGKVCSEAAVRNQDVDSIRRSVTQVPNAHVFLRCPDTWHRRTPLFPITGQVQQSDQLTIFIICSHISVHSLAHSSPRSDGDSSPHITQSNTITSLHVIPHVPSPHHTSPHILTSHHISPHITPPHHTSSHLTSGAHLMSLHHTSPHLTSTTKCCK